MKLSSGDLVLGSTNISGALAARPAAGVANRIFIATDTNEIYRDTGAAWNKIGSGAAGAPALSSITAAMSTNSIANGAFAQSWNWALSADGSAFALGESVASSGGTGAQYLTRIGTQPGSTAAPLSVVTRGVEAFRVDAVNPQLVANSGSVGAPGYAFAGDQSSGLYLPAGGQLAASVGGVRALWLGANANSAFGTGALAASSSGGSNVALGAIALGNTTTGASNTALGAFSMENNVAGSFNVGLGYAALNHNTASGLTAVGANALGSNTSGAYNTAVGQESLFSNTTGSNNTALGNYALSANTTGATNTAVGFNALATNGTGQANTSVGSYALYLNTTGANNVAVGALSLLSNTVGDQNTALGNWSLQNNTSGRLNTAVGVGTLYNNVTGVANTALGNNALTNNIEWNNTAIGNAALFSNSSGTRNAALAVEALAANTSGSDNVALGYHAGYMTALGDATNANVTGSSNTFVGAYAMPGTAAPLSHASAIGAEALVTTSNTIALGRVIDKTVIGASGDDGTAYNLQVSGGISVAAGDLVLGSSNVSGLLSARPAFGVANRIYIATDTNEIYRDSGVGWNKIAAAGATALSSITAATTANTIANSANTQVWNWALTGDTTAFALGESAPATGGSGSQYLGRIGTLAASTAIPLSVSTRGVEAFRVDSINPQLVANDGSLAAPGYAFAGAQSTGLYLPAAGQLAASVAGTRALSISSGSLAVGSGALVLDAASANNNTAFGSQALAANVAGVDNVAIGYAALTSNLGDASTAVGSYALNANSNGQNNTAIGYSALASNTDGNYNTASGNLALASLTTGWSNTAVRSWALIENTAGDGNTAVGDGALGRARGQYNTALGKGAGGATTNASTTDGSTFIGYAAAPADNAIMADSGYITLLGSNSSASGLAAANPNAYMTAIGSGASVTTINTITLGRRTDKTVIGATGDDGTAYNLQVSGGIKARSGGVNIAAGDLVLGSSNVSGTLAARPAFGVANRIYIATDTNEIYRDTGAAWIRIARGTGATSSLNSLTALTANNTLANGAFGQNWNWTLTGNSTAFGIGETAASSGGSGTQYLLKVTTLAGSTAIPLSVSTRGTEAFRIDSVNPQLVAHAGTLAAPSYAFNGNQGTGFYLPASGQLGAAVGGVRSLWLSSGSAALGVGALAADASGNATAFGTQALAANTSGFRNTALGYQAMQSNSDGYDNLAAGDKALKANTSGFQNAALGSNALVSNTLGYDNAALGFSAQQNGTTGYQNVALGSKAMQFVGDGHDNLASGFQALINNTSGYQNVAIGSKAGVTVTNPIVGSNMTLVGYNSGIADTAAMAGSGQITLIGAGASASGLGATNVNAYMTALGAGAAVTSINTVVLGRTTDNVAIGQTSAGAYQLTVNGTAGGTSAYVNASDARFKMHITPVVNAIGTIKSLQGVHYEFNRAAFPTRNFESGRQLGFIAQQIEPFVPEVVRTDRDGYKGVQYSQLVPLLAEGIKEQQLVLQHLVKKDPATLLVDIKTFQASDAIFDNIKATNIKVAALEAETARIKKLDADRIDAKSLRSDVMKTGEAEVFVSAGAFQPIFMPQDEAQYIVNATADDGSNAFASVALMAGKLTVTPISGKGIDVTALGAQVGLVAASKKIKATWIRMS
ncbi:hypothetical protein RCH09_002340 [Actimicrobium sp. GrIS 1.19]|uniref:tail fiber domain-containing protein n=1 Tax=Actimicrobium sp. GrIS 1.19 TaxID=3071708 RepID=UPI002DFB272E|nr:hypothetical protein [Actimicrobium sp. GrIS 1.19]